MTRREISYGFLTTFLYINLMAPQQLEATAFSHQSKDSFKSNPPKKSAILGKHIQLHSMSAWSPENAKRAYLQVLKMAKKGKEPDVAEFISALAAGNNARLMVVASSDAADSTALALAAAAHQTGGQVVCISCEQNESKDSKKALGVYGDYVEFVVGDAKSLLLGDYKGADFALVDCDIPNAREVFIAAFKGANKDGAFVVGYNVKHRVSRWRQLKASFLPIGDGLLVNKIDPHVKRSERVVQRKNRWIVQVDKCTGEEHIFRVTSPNSEVQIEV